jgi:hypothetical protein
MKVLTFIKSISADHDWLKCLMPSFPISGVFDGLKGLFPDSSGRSSRGTSLTSSGRVNPLGHSPCCLIPTSQNSTFTTDLFFSIQPLIAADSLFRIGLPSAQCDAPRSPSPRLPRDRCHALPLRVLLSKRAQAADGPRCCRRPPVALHGAYQGRFAAHKDRFGFRGLGHWDLTMRTGRDAQKETEHGRHSG